MYKNIQIKIYKVSLYLTEFLNKRIIICALLFVINVIEFNVIIYFKTIENYTKEYKLYQITIYLSIFVAQRYFMK